MKEEKICKVLNSCFLSQFMFFLEENNMAWVNFILFLLKIAK